LISSAVFYGVSAVSTGVVAATLTGPAVLLSFAIAGIASAAAALSYAELAGIVPVAGSPYIYGYAVLSELADIGWICCAIGCRRIQP
jgi:basic amino acid/polyamine antiporter, APA family